MDKMFWLFSNIDIIFSLYIGIWSSSSWGQVRLESGEIIVEVVLQTLFKNKQISNDYEWINVFYRRGWRIIFNLTSNASWVHLCHGS